jgi:hypothetical protein
MAELRRRFPASHRGAPRQKLDIFQSGGREPFTDLGLSMRLHNSGVRLSKLPRTRIQIGVPKLPPGIRAEIRPPPRGKDRNGANRTSLTTHHP